MAELNERQLLLLSNLMYYAGSRQQDVSVSEIANRALRDAQNYDSNSRALSGGYEDTPSEMVEIANAILGDPELCELTVTMSHRSNGVHAACLVDSAGNAVVAVRGTGGTYEAWSDNFEGAYGHGTECQLEFGRFMQDVGARYDNITITGHSKGGNLAQYATVTMGDKIDRCVSFDGQGFSFEFCQKYADEIRANRHKIKSINGEDDIVNTLLESIADETVYLNTNDELHSHSPYNLWKTNEGDGNLNAGGEYWRRTAQSDFPQGLDKALQSIVLLVNMLPDGQETAFMDLVGSCVGMWISNDTGWLGPEHWVDFLGKIWEFAKECVTFGSLGDIVEILRDAYVHVTKAFERKEKDAAASGSAAKPCSFAVKYDGLGRTAESMETCGSIAVDIAEELAGVQLTSSGLAGVNRALRKLEERISSHAGALSLLGGNLYEIRGLYSGAEDQICTAYSGS